VVKKDTIITISIIQILSVYWFSFFGYATIQVDDLVYISAANALYGLSFIMFLQSKIATHKILSAIAMSGFAVVLYVEIMHDGSDWKVEDFFLALIVMFNVLLSLFVIDKSTQKNE
jgi:hypothetical protein